MHAKRSPLCLKHSESPVKVIFTSSVRSGHWTNYCCESPIIYIFLSLLVPQAFTPSPSCPGRMSPTLVPSRSHPLSKCFCDVNSDFSAAPPFSQIPRHFFRGQSGGRWDHRCSLGSRLGGCDLGAFLPGSCVSGMR